MSQMTISGVELKTLLNIEIDFGLICCQSYVVKPFWSRRKYCNEADAKEYIYPETGKINWPITHKNVEFTKRTRLANDPILWIVHKEQSGR